MNGKPGTAALRVPVLVALLTAAPLIEAVRCSSLSSLLGGDVWWHLSTGLWMLQRHVLSHTGLFSQASKTPWTAASWLYDLKLAVFYRLFGLRAIPIFAMSFKAGLALITFFLAAGGRGKFWCAVALSAVAQYILGAEPPTPAYASSLFFGIELLLLLEIRRSWGANARVPPAAWCLPALFLVWANLDPHFVEGIALLLIFLVAQSAKGFLRPAAAQSLRSTSRIAMVCFLATLVTPYFVQPYRVFFSTAFSAANPYLPDCKAPGFRQPQDYVLLLLAMSAFLALGLGRSRDLFLVTLLALAAALSFHSQRDVWLTAMVAVAVIGEMAAGVETDHATAAATNPAKPAHFPRGELLLAVAATIVVLLAASLRLSERGPAALLAKAAHSYPVNASDYIRERRLSQPIFNSFEWGGFLTYYLPEYPVAIDSRTDLYGDDFIIQYSKAMNAEIRYTDFPAMANAQTILLPRSAIMAQALAMLPGYKLAYSDAVAMVITKQ